jgi:hypothetical protein
VNVADPRTVFLCAIKKNTECELFCNLDSGSNPLKKILNFLGVALLNCAKGWGSSQTTKQDRGDHVR